MSYFNKGEDVKNWAKKDLRGLRTFKLLSNLHSSEVFGDYKKVKKNKARIYKTKYGNLTIKEIAEKCGCSTTTISNLKNGSGKVWNGRAPLETMDKVIDFLHENLNKRRRNKKTT